MYVKCMNCRYASDFIGNSCFCKIKTIECAHAADTAGYVTNSRKDDFMDMELEKEIELLEWQCDNALRLRCPLVARKYQRMIDELAKESRNRSMNDKKRKDE